MRTKNILILLSTFLAILLTYGVQGEAKVEEFNNLEDINEYIQENQDRDLQIKLSKNFDFEENYLNIGGDYDITIDGNDNTFNRSLRVYDSGNGDAKLKNFNFVDSKSSDYNVFVEVVNNGPSTVEFDNFSFIGINNEGFAPVHNRGTPNKLKIKNSLFKNNTSYHGGGIQDISSENETIVENTTFINNKSTGDGAGAISTINGSAVKLKVMNSVFIGNENTNEGDSEHTAGAIYVGLDDESDVEIVNSYFKENTKEMMDGDTGINAGAIFIYGLDKNETAKITGNTFNDNKGTSGGGAIVVKPISDEIGEVNFINNTFYKNNASSSIDNFYSGGAILIRDFDGELNGPGIEQSVNSTNNTFYKNSIERSNNVIPYQEVKGGAIAIHRIEGTHTLINDLLVGNQTLNNQPNTKIFENVFISNDHINVVDSLGFDNGVASKTTEQMVYGKYPVELVSNQGKVKAGVLNDQIIIPTLPIAPKMNVNLGVANMNVSNAPELDQRGYKRTGKNDNGAIEISSVLYDANKGNFTLNELKKYDGQTYYEGKNPKQYAKVDVPSKQYTILDGKKILKPVRSGYTFLGWSNSKAAKVQNSKYKAGTKHKVEDQLVVYAVWKENKFTIKYFNNGKTTGIIPSQKAVKSGTTVTVKNPTKMKRKGYKFIGWSPKANATKADANYKVGKKFKLAKNIKLYAIWKR